VSEHVDAHFLDALKARGACAFGGLGLGVGVGVGAGGIALWEYERYKQSGQLDIYSPTVHTEKTGNILLDLRRGQANPLLSALKAYRQAMEEGNLLLVTYECVCGCLLLPHQALSVFPSHGVIATDNRCHTIRRDGDRTVSDYLLILQSAALSLAPFRQNACFFLAAAVSDFFVPPQEMQEHKIQSAASKGGDDALELRLKHVPKCLPLLRREWAPHAFVVSFKLETDPDMLMKKALGAIGKCVHTPGLLSGLLSGWLSDWQAGLLVGGMHLMKRLSAIK
jgi:hypothetical protein